jgi:hypothetical protein
MTSYATSELKRHALNTGIEPLGSGSDFTVFLQHLGVSTCAFLPMLVAQTDNSVRYC